MTIALITGASSGIGAAFARELAARKMDLILVARSQARLEQLATELQNQFGIEATVLVQDLTLPQAANHIFEAVQARNLQVDLLINNAGFGDYGGFAQRPVDRKSDMVKLNVLALTELTHCFLAPMQTRKQGAIINVASIAAFQPLPYLAVYAATKAFVLHFSEALWAENQNTGIKILALCPGPTDTNFFAESGMDQNPKMTEGSEIEDPVTVVKKTLKSLEKSHSHLVTGNLQTQLLVNASRITPRDWLTKALISVFKIP
ncbi:SDR family NAD(P)-dependent oxidoreductase [Synechococcales cyanobacterium C]|uniref:SDR family NAD(P)-dependent oxidoreductase n=1 Tax=Petrachloros mirabilis ULC683 TaxID=2781853 RepID=A0A8K2AGS6_9CYAN|nr:SDR family oxidoreductase [Petrachloros mirabilis]NCJ05239.1 SDR family NAD(P)-dependent oxidoreductase [Petrachloros mirabilis ULC683]